MPFPVAGASIAAISLIPALIASSQNGKVNNLRQCKPFPPKSTPTSNGYYYLRGSLDSKDAIKVDIKDGSISVEHGFGIMQYEIDRCIESKHITKVKVDKNGNTANAKQRGEGEVEEYKEEKRSHWVKSFENMHRSPKKYATILEINGININDFRDLFVLRKEYEIFTASPYLNETGSVNNNQNVLNLSLNVNTGNDKEAVIGEQERKTLGYQHKWYGVNIGDQYTVIGYWNGNGFVRGDKMNIVSKYSYYEIVNQYESGLWWAKTLCIAGLLLSGGVTIYETDLLSKV